MREVLTFVLAGGKGERLDPLTRDRAKPAVPFGGIYRIVDFALSNCVNSGLRRIFLLTQYKSFSLQRHILEGWNIYSNQLGEFIDVVPAQQRISSDWYRGTADAIYQNLNMVGDYDPSLVLILAGDHVYKMDYRKLIDYHVDKGADMTVACVTMPKSDSIHFGVVEVNKQNMVEGFQEKPEKPRTIPHSPNEIFGSMGIYLFNTETLKKELADDAARTDSGHDFGKNIIPQMLAKKLKVFAYDFAKENEISPYWRDIGTRDSYYQANMDLCGPKPKFSLDDKSWPLRTSHHRYTPLRVYTTGKTPGSVVDSLIAGGCVLESARVEHSVVSNNVVIRDGVLIRNSVIMDSVTIGKGAQIQGAIIDKNVNIPAGTKIGFYPALDRQRFVLTTSGIVIVAKKTSL
ncbi:MAG: glucose-1-phosphate adenylyltransferase [Candidatus Omnitrophica bacterium]|nr:glucose-1-phosphate adenylyltransferase [Candidatus Omnitrophota bacterium]MDE2008746.1 glucose-1-phosphate adenylyltransferase [Candidatus Omnitrophota bacterium]MDE2215170.1 glucose-1-phosphate adenylyltransferase [Candidatus Omnitrophota bacterium]MDE2232173.1 glucose-1-phosphate adenylyltransferase [Candidatus Omnitrophota bacterium]